MGPRGVPQPGDRPRPARLLACSCAREWRNRQTRTVQVRVPERAWGFNSPLAHKLRSFPDLEAVTLVIASANVPQAHYLGASDPSHSHDVEASAEEGEPR